MAPILLPAVLLSLAALLLAPASPSRAAELVFNETLVAGNASEQRAPAVSGAVVVFEDGSAASPDLSFVEGTAPPWTFALAPGPQPAADVHADTIVWAEGAAGSRNLRRFDIPSLNPMLLDAHPADDYAPRIEGSDVVFLSDRSGSVQTHWRSLVGGPAFQISDGLVLNDPPSVDGSFAVWTELVGGSLDVVGSFLGIGAFPIAASPDNEFRPSVSQDRVAYLRNGDVEVFDLPTGQRTNLTDDPVVQQQVRISGDHVVFSDARNGNLDLFLHVLSTGQTFQLTTDPSDQRLGDLDGNLVVYEDERLGSSRVWRSLFILTPLCGDGHLDEGEQCDDGNSHGGDCCSSTCQFESGSGTPACCSQGQCRVGQGCGLVCFTPGGQCQQPGGPGSPCSCALP